jgi:hypothetical protein
MNCSTAYVLGFIERDDYINKWENDRAERHNHHTDIDEDDGEQWKPTLVTVFKPTPEITAAARCVYHG